MRSLLDVNVLLALLDSDHVDHVRAGDWLDEHIASGWASCPITENGFVRILSQPRYPSPVSPSTAIALLDRARAGGHHAFWPCHISLLDDGVIDRTRLHGARQVTDAYLLALATTNHGSFVTFDQSLSPSCVRGATTANLTILG